MVRPSCRHVGRSEEVSPRPKENRHAHRCSGTSAPRSAATSASTCPPTAPSTGSARPRGLKWAIPVALVATPAYLGLTALAIQ